MFVITGATGNTGSTAVKTLLAAGKKVRAVVRNATKAKPLADLGAEVFVADLNDQAALARAFEGAEGVSLISAPDMGATNFIADRKALTEKQVHTLASVRAPHVVLLSSVGSQHAEGTGLIRTTYHLEQQLVAAGLAATFVRASFFVENWGAGLHPVKQDGVLPSFIRADQAIPMSSTPDIGKALADALLEGPKGTKIVELSGPVDVSPNDVAATFAKILGKPVKVVEAPMSAVVPTFTSFGISQNIAELFQEMYEGIANGRVAPASGVRVRGTTSLETTLRALVG
ncbi:MAG: NmrA family NAD(P)-binding protein [Polyangiaceae bacterium]